MSLSPVKDDWFESKSYIIHLLAKVHRIMLIIECVELNSKAHIGKTQLKQLHKQLEQRLLISFCLSFPICKEEIIPENKECHLPFQ